MRKARIKFFRYFIKINNQNIFHTINTSWLSCDVRHWHNKSYMRCKIMNISIVHLIKIRLLVDVSYNRLDDSYIYDVSWRTTFFIPYRREEKESDNETLLSLMRLFCIMCRKTPSFFYQSILFVSRRSHFWVRFSHEIWIRQI